MPGARARRAARPLPIVNSSGDIQQVHRDSYGRYGSPRIHVELKAQGRGVSRGRIERLMRHHGIRAIMARPRRVRTTDSRHDFPIAPNLLERNFTAAAPNRIWLADITYVETDQGWLYLATVMDLYSRKIVGWAMRGSLARRTAVGSIDDGHLGAAAWRRPDPPFRSRRSICLGATTASADAVRRLPASMSRKADCYDNAPMESFFHTLKTELVHHREICRHAQKPSAISLPTSKASTIEPGVHSAIGYISPIEMELKAA